MESVKERDRRGAVLGCDGSCCFCAFIERKRGVDSGSRTGL